MTDLTHIPLAVDLDGTLIKTDTLFEALLGLLKQKPWLIFSVLGWFLHGRARLKQEIAQRVSLDPAALPYHLEFLAFLKAEKACGRKLILVSATDQRLADAVGQYVGLFDVIKGSDGHINLRDDAKRAYLDEQFPEGYDYAGNSHPDLAVWKGSKGAYVVNASADLKDSCAALCEVRAYFPKTKLTLKNIGQIIGIYFWAIPLFILFLFFQASYFHHISAGLLAFLSLCGLTSCAALLYSLLNLPQLRACRSTHPLATGDFAIAHAMVALFILFVGTLIIVFSLALVK